MVERNGRPGAGAPGPEADEATLGAFFAAARGADRAPDRGPTTALLSAILADAAAVAAERRAAAAAAPPAARGRWPGTLRTIGGWRGLTALAACAALGFWLGIAGEVTIDTGRSAWPSFDASADASADQGVDDQLGAFYDLASVEG
jgi:hypothetical protein